VPVRAAKHFFWTPEAARYVQWWARFAGMDDRNRKQPDCGNPMLHAAGPPANGGLGFLAACGVFGDELKKADPRRACSNREAVSIRGERDRTLVLVSASRARGAAFGLLDVTGPRRSEPSQLAWLQRPARKIWWGLRLGILELHQLHPDEEALRPCGILRIPRGLSVSRYCADV